MWECSYECNEGVIIIHAISAHGDWMNTLRDVSGGYGRETWFETPRGFLRVDALHLDDGFVMAFEAGGEIVQSDDLPCFCAMLTGIERITAWLQLGGISTEVGQA